MNLSEEQTQKMLKDPHCQAFIEAMARILVHQNIHLEAEAEETSTIED